VSTPFFLKGTFQYKAVKRKKQGVKENKDGLLEKVPIPKMFRRMKMKKVLIGISAHHKRHQNYLPRFKRILSYNVDTIVDVITSYCKGFFSFSKSPHATVN
jgi:hypothetical protein